MSLLLHTERPLVASLKYEFIIPRSTRPRWRFGLLTLQMLGDEVPSGGVVEFVAPFEDHVLEAIAKVELLVIFFGNRCERLPAIAMIDAVL